MANINRAKDKTVTATVRGKFKDDYSRGLGKFHGSTTKAFGAIAAKVAALASAYLGLRAAMSFLQESINVAAKWERLNMTLVALYKNVEIAGQKFAAAVKFAAKTPYEVDKVVDAFIKLKVYGMDSMDWLKKAGDMAATFGRPIAEAVRALGLLKSGAFGDAFMRLRELFGITSDNLKAKGLEFAGGLYKGTIDQALKAVSEVIEERYSGMMEKLSSTFEGVKSNFSDTIQQIQNEIGERFLPYLKQALLEFQSLLTKNKGKMVDSAVSIADAMITIGKGVLTFFQFVIKAVQGYEMIANRASSLFNKGKAYMQEKAYRSALKTFKDVTQPAYFREEISQQTYDQQRDALRALHDKLQATRGIVDDLETGWQGILENSKNTDAAAEALRTRLSAIQAELRASVGQSKELANNVNSAAGAPPAAADGGTPPPIPGLSQQPEYLNASDLSADPEALAKEAEFWQRKKDMWNLAASFFQEKAGMIRNAYQSMAIGTTGALYDMLFAHEISIKGIINMLAQELAAVMKSIATRSVARAMEFQTLAAVSMMNPMTAWAGPIYAAQASAMWSLAGWAMATAPVLGAISNATGGGSSGGSQAYDSGYSSGGGYYNGSGPSGSVPANAIAGGGSKTLNIKFVGLFDQKHIASALDTEEGEQVIVGRMINNAAREGDASDVFQVKI